MIESKLHAVLDMQIFIQMKLLQVEQGACGVEWVWVKDWFNLSRKTPGRTRKGRTTNDERIKTNRKECFENKNEAKPCQKKQALKKDFDKIAPSRPIILRGGISQRRKKKDPITT